MTPLVKTVDLYSLRKQSTTSYLEFRGIKTKQINKLFLINDSEACKIYLATRFSTEDILFGGQNLGAGFKRFGQLILDTLWYGFAFGVLGAFQ